MVETIVFKWLLFLGIRTQNVPLSAFIFQNKVAEFTKRISIEIFKALDTWLQEQKRRIIQNFEELATAIPEKHLSHENIYKTDKFGFSITVFLIKLNKLGWRSVQVKN